jgi:hypothetical protein
VKQVVATKDEAKAAFAKRWRARLASETQHSAGKIVLEVI